MFDQSTGQVFKEVVAPRPPDAYQHGRDWSRRTGLPPRKGRSGQGRKGPRSLADMAMHLIAENVGDLTEQHLSRDDLPRRYLWRIWRLLENRGICFQAWKIFSKFLLTEDDEKTLSLYRYRQHICQPTESLRHYLRPLESHSFDFVAHLVIAGGCSFSENELLALANLKNLAILEIIQPPDDLRAVFPIVDDRLIRSWSEMNDPFPLLRILRLWSDESTSMHSLKYVSKFPSLIVYDINAARSDWKGAADSALDEGWEMAEPLHGPHDSLLWYLMLFDSVEESKPRQLQGLARNIDEGLINFCQSSSQPIKFVSAQEVPSFLDHIGDAAKRNLSLYVDVPGYEAQTCKGFPFETWAFWLYSFIGQLIKDEDLKRAQLKSERKTVSEKLILPSKPFACLQLGHYGGRPGITPAVSYVRRGLFSTARYTFFRTSSASSRQEAVRKNMELMKPTVQLGNVETGLNPNRKKRRRLDDILQSFLGS
ncbi:cbs domain-containing protein [Colletotrichum truncatum]|uniref:Cbs domain-containing protein n=1 Tax=Colletotrichum truncatum TaxID=5467 RepID=A0ACC3Z5W3_COLTU|nr:cbs domain-containing protein [Colletotrichum truncatum]KAF6787240.1 cbs domain-containing protein [Colletotrichum truncatum]